MQKAKAQAAQAGGGGAPNQAPRARSASGGAAEYASSHCSAGGRTVDTGPAAGGTTVTVTGVGFTGETGVTIGGAAATAVTILNDTTLSAVTPAGTAGAPVDVIVTTPGGSNAAGNALFTYV